METSIDLDEIFPGIGKAERLLANTLESMSVGEMVGHLDTVDGLLAEAMVEDTSQSQHLARRLGQVRDCLGGHVVAASGLEDAGQSDSAVASLLLRGAKEAQAEIQAITSDDEGDS